LTVHSEEYVNKVKRMSRAGRGFIDAGDTPAVKGIYEAARLIVGGSILAADLMMSGGVSHAFNPGGGLHHAKKDGGEGFCVFNDIAIAARHLQRRYDVMKIAIVDIDGHHGNGTQEIFYNEPILTVSFHHIGIYPLSGYVGELGSGAGKGYSRSTSLS